MPTVNIKNKIPWRYRRFWRLFRREKPLSIDLTYSYQYMMRFPRLPITVPPLVPTLMSYRCGESGNLPKRYDEDDFDILPKKILRNNSHHYQQQQQHMRRRFSKRYSDIVGPLSTKVYLPRKDSIIQKNSSSIIPLSPHKHYRTSFKRNNTEGLYTINSHNKKSSDILSSLSKTRKKDQSIVTRRYSSKNKHLSTTNSVDLLAHRMQAAMSTELMHSLDRNFVFGDKKQTSNYTLMNRSHSFHISIQPTNDCWDKSRQKQYYYHIIPRVKECLDDEQKSVSFDEPTPDYEEEIIIRRINNDEIGEEPIADYDDPKSITMGEFEEKSETLPTLDDVGISLLCIAPQTSVTPSSETNTQDQSSIPPTPPPLPNITIEQNKATFRCRTIADQITPNHKLILKDEAETIINVIKEKQSVPQIQKDRPKKSHHNPTIDPKPCFLHLSKELLEKTTLRKVSYPVSRSYSTYGSMSQLNDHNTESTTLCQKSSIIDDQPLDGLSSSATTSIVTENEYEHRSSSKIYNDYKRRASLISVPISNTLNNTYNHPERIHPMHTHIGLRSSTSSSATNDKPNDISLSNKQMNVCVINQLNQHLSTRFHKQQQEICLKKNTNTIKEDIHDQITEDRTNVYDEPQNIEISNTISTKSPNTSPPSMPPPPPPLPAGGFRSVLPQLNRPSSSPRASIMTLPREISSTDVGCSTGTSTISSKLSDTRILRELRTNPLFAKAKQHLEIEPERSKDPNSYLRLDKCSKDSSSITQINESSNNIETFLIHSDEFNSIIDNKHKRIKSNEINQIDFKTQCRQSELELLFQKRAQRNEQNLTQ